MLTVIDPADDLQLLTPEELRVAAGLDPTDTSQDVALAIQGLRAASALAGACGVARAAYDASLAPLRGEAPRTLKAETLVETLRVRPNYQYATLYLARWPILSITSVVSNTITLLPEDFDIDIPGGAITRISGDQTLIWPYGRVTIEYEAGYDEPIPADLKSYAALLTGYYHKATGSDPNERRVEIPGVITLERWVDTASTDSLVPEDVMAGLQRDGYRRVLPW